MMRVWTCSSLASLASLTAVAGGLVIALSASACGPDFDSLFANASSRPRTDAAPEDEDAAGGKRDASADSGGSSSGGPVDAGADTSLPSSTVCTPGLDCGSSFVCNATSSSCAYACNGCGCTCPQRLCPTTTGTCETSCAPGTKCDALCNSDVSCSFTSHGATGALFTCGLTTKTCAATCDQGGDCDLLCDTEAPGATCQLTCAAGSQCLLTCPHTSSCTLDCVGGSPQTCAGGSKACNHPCP